ncbi:uncharacterized protein PHACADRAFT_259149 [Phanerochaete carnosa HHB-10118-sp]|uniref:Uncharacterized protein n=1 Tax=Phanerochaete carnosa (strain HHB-10118-sp) TaxID=650164 RepID=K5USR9_PHACS|nr:uncharacterized protein PHACADRAFT_259149 [Phanerochaete carnosa HHB-10118-sp]EKM52976.1 hypothetical protein PHACADRAFT_259149 [Phanerochaete carnosa HHB-10118-sp]
MSPPRRSAVKIQGCGCRAVVGCIAGALVLGVRTSRPLIRLVRLWSLPSAGPFMRSVHGYDTPEREQWILYAC